MAKNEFFDLRVLGARRLQKKFKKLENKVGRKVMRGAAREAMEPVAVLAKQRVPVDTGRLQRSIKTANLTRRGAVGAQVRTGTRKQLRIPKDAKGYYPAAIEYGTRKQAARSFLRAALSAKRGQVISSLAGIIRRKLAEV